ncbi:spore coat U domain-containing protein [Oxalobacteraceae bacterium OTU3REALA1]|nr:spore coat U domain-containing protein [Oxalobacteraceae bacterium OTU3REALA1]
MTGAVAALLRRLPVAAPRTLAPALLLTLLGGHARADSCAITPQNFVFPSVSSISSVDVYASASFKVTCTWTNFLGNLLTPNVTVCLYLGAGTNSSATVTSTRQIGNGALRANYNIYTDATYTPAKVWGGWVGTNTPTPIIFSMTKGGGVGSLEQNISLFGKLSADATLSGLTLGPDDLTFTSDFGAGSGLMQYVFFLTGTPACALGPTMPIAFRVSAAVINDCNINVGNLVFPNSKLLTSAVRTTSSMSVVCSKNTAYRVALSGGANGTSTARRMRKVAGAELVAYRISTTLDGSSWGDGSGGTVIISGTGNGGAQTQTLYGLVPAQGTPSPGDYKDTVTATVSF